MKVTKNQLRNIIREAVRRKLDLGPLDESVTYDDEPLDISGPFVSMAQLQRVINEEYEDALMERQGLNEGDPSAIMAAVKDEGALAERDMGTWSPNVGAPKASPPPLPPHARGSTPQALRKKSAPGEQLRQFKSSVNMMANAATKAQEGSVKDALQWLDKVIHFAQQAKAAVN